MSPLEGLPEAHWLVEPLTQARPISPIEILYWLTILDPPGRAEPGPPPGPELLVQLRELGRLLQRLAELYLQASDR